MAEISSPPSVLVVDDEAGFRSLLGWKLSRLGLFVLAVSDGNQALEIVRERSFDVVITDLTMPRVQGLSVLEEIKRASPRTEVIIITGFGTVETAVYAMKKGAHDFLLKPFDLSQLIAMVTQAVIKSHPDFQPADPAPE